MYRKNEKERRINVIVLLMMVMVFGFISCESTHHLVNISTEGVNETLIRGEHYQSIEKDGLIVDITGRPEKNTVRYIVGIHNYKKSPVLFDFADLEVQQGNYEDLKWKSLSVYTSDNYSKKLKTQNFWEQVGWGFAAGLNAASASYSTSTSYGTVSSYGGNSYNYTANTTTYNPGAGSAVASSYLLMADYSDRIDKQYMDKIDQLYLKTSDVHPKDSYFGLFYTKQGNNPDYKISIPLSGDVFEFQFRRSDYKEVLNPWLDRSKPRHSIMISYLPKSERFGALYKYSNNEGWGGYFGLTMPSKKGDDFQNVVHARFYGSGPDELFRPSGLSDPDPNDSYHYSDDYDWYFVPDEKSTFIKDLFGMYGGFSYKVLPYTWFLGGIGLGYYEDIYHYGKLFFKRKIDPNTSYSYIKDIWLDSYSYYSYSSLLIAPQIGINFIFNKIDIGLLASVQFAESLTKGNLVFEVLGGIAI